MADIFDAEDTSQDDDIDLLGAAGVAPSFANQNQPAGTALTTGSDDSPSAGYTRRAQMLSEQQATSHDNAMQYLRQALNNSPQLTSEQAIAAALLAAVPSLGGAIIGKSVGSSYMPPGAYGLKNLPPTGAAAGGAVGLAAGQAASSSYLQSITDDAKAKTPILEKMGVTEAAQAQQLGTEANANTNAAQEIDSKIAMMPLEEKHAGNMATQQAQAWAKARADSATTPGATDDSADKPDAVAAFRIEHPDTWAKLMTGKPLSLQEGATIPPELVSKMPGLIRASNNTTRTQLYATGADAVLFGIRGTPLDKVDDTPLNPALTKDATKFSLDVIPKAKTALGNLALAQDAISKLGIATSLSGLTDQQAQQIGVLLQRVKEANLATVGVMGELSGVVGGGSHMTDQKLSLLDNNAIQPIITELNANPEKAKQMIFNSKDLVLSQLGEIQNELARRLGTQAQAFGARFNQPIGGIDINPWTAGGDEANPAQKTYQDWLAEARAKRGLQ